MTASTPAPLSFNCKRVCALSAVLVVILIVGWLLFPKQSPVPQTNLAKPLLEELFAERLNSVVAVEGILRNEVDREEVQGIGVVIDNEGRIALQESFLPSWLPPSRFGDFKVKRLNEDGDGAAAIYLGQDYVSGWHYVQVVSTEDRQWMRPISDFAPNYDVRVGDWLWGIGVMSENWNYKPYFLSAHMSVNIFFPWLMGFTDQAVSSPGSVVFDRYGAFVGWTGMPTTEERILMMPHRTYRVGIQSLRESNSFVAADTFESLVGRIPSKQEGDAKPWMGVSGLHPLDREVAEVMALQNKGALVVSDVIEGSPAAAGGLKERDIIVSFNGEPLPNLQPTFILPQWLEYQLVRKQIGDSVSFGVVRGGGEPKELTLTLGSEPTTLKQAERHYFNRLGLGIRQFVLFDGIAKLLMKPEAPGVIADFVRSNAATDSAGLERGDWILAIGGTDITDFASARDLLEAIENDASREEFVLLIRRNNETKLLRVKLH